MRRSRNIVDLLEELIREILMRLPVKALLRCKCVCKQWRALIRSPCFIDGHFKHESNRDSLLIQREPFGFVDVEIEFSMYTDDGRHLSMDMPSGIKSCCLLGHANGIFCAVDPELGSVVLFNHATRKFKPLPPIPFRELEEVSLQFGFGFDAYSGDYKVVVFVTKMKSKNFFSVYNSSSDSWREKTEIVGSLNGRVYMVEWDNGGHEVVLNGVYHWLMEYRSILGFDMRTENFHEIPLPDAITRDLDFINVDMTAYGDSLAMLSSYVYVDGRFDMWVMGRDGFWSKSFSFALPLSKMSALFVWKKNELWLEISTMEGEEPESRSNTLALFECDISTQELRKVEPEFDNYNVCRILSYKESLFSLEGERDMPDFVQGIFELCDDSADDSIDGEIDIFEVADEGEIAMPAHFQDIFGPGDD